MDDLPIVLGLHRLGFEYKIFRCDASTGEGVLEGMQWLLDK